MSVRPAHSRNSGHALGAPPSQKGSSAHALSLRGGQKLRAQSDECERENDDPSPGSAGGRGDINCTYVISTRKTPGDAALTPSPAGRLALQRRVTRNRESSLLGTEVGESPEKGAETCLTLQRRARTGSADRRPAAAGAPGETGTGVTTVSGDTRSRAAPSAPSAEGTKDAAPLAGEKCKERLSALSGADDSVAPRCLSHSTPVGSRNRTEVVRSGPPAGKPMQSRLDIKVSRPGNSSHRSTGQDAAKSTGAFGSLEKRTPAKRPTEPRPTPRGSTPQLTRPAAAAPKTSTPGFQVRPRPEGSLLASQRDRPQEQTLPPRGESAGRGAAAERGPCKAESSQVTVAVRVRPFSKRYVPPCEPGAGLWVRGARPSLPAGATRARPLGRA